MKAKVKCIDLRTVDGKVIFVLHLYEKEVVLEDYPEAPAEKPESKKETPKNVGQCREAMMTDAQKRFLFRILAERGIEGDKAYDHLKERFQVDTLKEVTKMEASKAIESLLGQGNGGKNGVSV